MKNLNTKTLLAASIASLISVNTFAIDGDTEKALTVTFDHPQSIAIADGTTSAQSNATSSNTGDITSTTWKVTSNNAVTVAFTGSSHDTSGTAIVVPILAKQEVNAKDGLISGAYDQLTTAYGVKIQGHSSVENATDTIEWGGGAAPTGLPTTLVNNADAAGVTKTFGAIMPSDIGEFTYTLYTEGKGDAATTQSGDYQAVVVTTITADEKDGQ
ncbi:MAG: hypothetical protein NZ824_01325 [Candidatus Thioglobus sp.]|nr:hypothetical protein [Candidatus Thioglobus sp.]